MGFGVTGRHQAARGLWAPRARAPLPWLPEEPFLSDGSARAFRGAVRGAPSFCRICPRIWTQTDCTSSLSLSLLYSQVPVMKEKRRGVGPGGFVGWSSEGGVPHPPRRLGSGRCRPCPPQRRGGGSLGRLSSGRPDEAG